MNNILYVSVHALHDVSCAQSMENLSLLRSFAQLYKDQLSFKSLSTFVFNEGDGSSIFNNLDDLEKLKQDCFNIDDNGITCYYARCTHHDEHSYTSGEARVLFGLFLDLLNSSKPDYIMLAGDDCFASTVAAEAARRKVPLAYFNIHQHNIDALDYAELIIDEQAMQRYNKDMNDLARDLLPGLSRRAGSHPQFYRSGYAYK